MDHEAKEERQEGHVVDQRPYPGSGAMLQIQGEWITTKYAERIQEAALRDDHMSFFLKKYQKKAATKHFTEYHYHLIDWNAIGDARRNLTDEQIKRVMKMMNGWLNTGRQKGHFGERTECPGCGFHSEDQLHLYQCTHPSARETRKRAFELLEQYYHEHKIPKAVYMPIVQECWATCTGLANTQNNAPRDTPVQRAIDTQSELGGEFLLRGYLTVEWRNAILYYTRDKAEQKLAHLQRAISTVLFEPLWEHRNTVLHGRESVVEQYERSELIDTLMGWKSQAGANLGHQQAYLVEYSYEDLQSWQTTTLRETIRLLEKAADNHRESLLNEGQTLITDFFQAEGSYDDSHD